MLPSAGGCRYCYLRLSSPVWNGAAVAGVASNQYNTILCFLVGVFGGLVVVVGGEGVRLGALGGCGGMVTTVSRGSGDAGRLE